MRCPQISTCELFPYFVKTPMVEYWKAKYCEAGYKECVRYQRTVSGQVVPLSLLPNGRTIQSSALDRSRKKKR